MFSFALSGQVCTLGIFQNVRAGRHQKSMSPTCSFQQGSGPREGQGFLHGLLAGPCAYGPQTGPHVWIRRTGMSHTHHRCGSVRPWTLVVE